MFLLYHNNKTKTGRNEPVFNADAEVGIVETVI